MTRGSEMTRVGKAVTDRRWSDDSHMTNFYEQSRKDLSSMITNTVDRDVIVGNTTRRNNVSGHAVRRRPTRRRWPVWPLDHATA